MSIKKAFYENILHTKIIFKATFFKLSIYEPPQNSQNINFQSHTKQLSKHLNTSTPFLSCLTAVSTRPVLMRGRHNSRREP